MNITEALKTKEITLNYQGRKMFYEDGEWIVIQHTHRKHSYDTLVQTENEKEAVEVLLGD